MWVCIEQHCGWRKRQSTAATTATRRRFVPSAPATRWSWCGRHATVEWRWAGASRPRWVTSAVTATSWRPSTDAARGDADVSCASLTPSWRARDLACENWSPTSRPPTAAYQVQTLWLTLLQLVTIFMRLTTTLCREKGTDSILAITSTNCDNFS